MFAGLIGLFGTGAMFSPNPAVIAVQVAAVALMIWARITFGLRSFHATANPTEGGLVTTGPYAHVRHPIYTAVCLFTAAAVAAHLSWTSAVFALLVVAGSCVRIVLEERMLRERYPGYAAYATRTKRMVPYVF